MLSRFCYFTGILFLVVGASVVCAALTLQDQSGKTYTVKLEPFASESLQLNFAAKKKAMVVCVGKRKSFLGLYVYDQHGNCVAWDDLITFIDQHQPGYPDAVAVEWFPQEDGFHRIEIVNFSGVPNEEIELAVK